MLLRHRLSLLLHARMRRNLLRHTSLLTGQQLAIGLSLHFLHPSLLLLLLLVELHCTIISSRCGRNHALSSQSLVIHLQSLMGHRLRSLAWMSEMTCVGL